MAYYRILVIGEFDFTDDCTAWNTYQDLKLAGHAVEMLDSRLVKGLVGADGAPDDELLSTFRAVFRPDYVASHGEAAAEVLSALEGTPAHDGPTPRHFIVEGYVGRDNFGDEFVLKTLCEKLYARYPGSYVSLVSYNPRRSLERHGLASTVWEEKSQINALLNGASALIFIAGIMFDDSFEAGSAGPADIFLDPGPQVPGQMALAQMAWLNDVPAVFCGIGAGPLVNPDACKVVKLASLTEPHFLTRDVATADYLRDAGVDESLVEEYADLAFSADFPQDSDAADVFLTGHDCDPGAYVVVSLRSSQGEYSGWSDQMRDAVASTLDALYEREGIRPLFMTFDENKKENADGDLTTHRDVAAHMEHGDMCMFADTLGFDMTTCLIRQARFVLSMRLHCSIIAAAQGVPCVGVNYNIKVEELYGQLGMGGYLLKRGASADQMLRACTGMLTLHDELSRRVAEKAAANRERALAALERLFELVDERCPEPTRQRTCYKRWKTKEAASLAKTNNDLKRVRAKNKKLKRELADLQVELSAEREKSEKRRGIKSLLGRKD